MKEEKYNMRWHTYPDHLRAMMREMMMSDDFADVTLISDDVKQMKAHRNILSACSPVFKKIFELQNNQPIIYLRGIQSVEVETILQFIYSGEAKIYLSRMNEFLLVAKSLEIKELIKNFDVGESESADTEETLIFKNPDADEKSFDTGEVCTESSYMENETYDTIVEKVEKSVSAEHYQKSNETEKYQESSSSVVAEEVQESTAESNIEQLISQCIEVESSESKYKCPSCDKILKGKGSLKLHYNSFHAGIKYSCNECDQQFSQTSNLRRHFQNVHEGIKHTCKLCGNIFTQKGVLTRHIQTVHALKTYECNLCSYKAAIPNYLRIHIQKNHRGADEVSARD